MRDPTCAGGAGALLAPPSRLPVAVGSVALAVIAVIGVLFAMQWAKALLIPILLGVMLSYALAPVVRRLHRWHLPRPLGATLVVGGLVAALVWGAVSLSDEARAFVDTLPQVTQKLRGMLRSPGGQMSAIDRVQQAATQLSQDGPRGRVTTPPPAPTTAAVDIRNALWSGTLGAVELIGQATIVVFIALFLLASGDTFRRKLVKLVGPRLRQKKAALEALDEITEQIQRYLLVQLAVSVLVGIATGIAFFAIGLEQAAVWGVVAGLTNLIPYVGGVVVGVGAAVVASLQFGRVDVALLAAGSSLAIHTVVGNVVTPWLTGRTSRLDPFVVFVGVLAFGWLWGAAGLLLAVPMLMVLKSVCDRVAALQPVAELLGP